jgi:hypothetical protein
MDRPSRIKHTLLGQSPPASQAGRRVGPGFKQKFHSLIRGYVIYKRRNRYSPTRFSFLRRIQERDLTLQKV